MKPVMVAVTDDLSFQNMHRRFLILALNKYKLKEHASFALGISMRTLQRWMNDFDVKKVERGEYVIIKHNHELRKALNLSLKTKANETSNAASFK